MDLPVRGSINPGKPDCRAIPSRTRRPERIIGLAEEISNLVAGRIGDIQGRTLGSYTANDAVVGFSITPGYETYKGLGWYGVVEQRLAARQIHKREAAAGPANGARTPTGFTHAAKSDSETKAPRREPALV